MGAALLPCLFLLCRISVEGRVSVLYRFSAGALFGFVLEGGIALQIATATIANNHRLKIKDQPWSVDRTALDEAAHQQQEYDSPAYDCPPAANG